LSTNKSYLFHRNGVIVESKYKPQSTLFKLQNLCLLLLLIESVVNFGVKWGSVYHTTSGVSLLSVLLR